ncbi:glucosyltransferase [Puttea exsequens]|nr:glucosyltransferase [Puttea exsequens]
MLYIWPYFAFFSAPLLYTYFLDVLASAFSPPLTLRSQNDKTAATRKRLPRLVIDIPAILLMLAIVHYNTIVHPFTLADNRHYMFYIFRLLLRHPAMKYIATPVYYICAVATIDALGDRERQGFQYSHPKGPSRGESKRNDKASAVSNTSSSPQGNRVSFLLIWLLATALSLCTAPLVEPRYCIVPWLTWRINVASPRRGDQGYDPRLWLETMWLLLVNAVTGYVFLFWGFAWPQEPGKIQRFMW